MYIEHVQSELSLNDIPRPVALACGRVIDAMGRDVTSASAMSSRCQDYSMALAHALTSDGIGHDEDGDPLFVYAAPVQLFDAPAEIAANEMAAGHYVCHVETDDGAWWIDLTAAQFGCSGPIVRMHYGW